MDLRHLRYFQAVAEELSYSKAARRLRVAQPALSRAVKEVEAFLGAPMLERSRHYVRLTPAGAILLREIAGLLTQWDESMRRVRRAAAGEEGELRLGYIGPPTQLFLARLLAEYRQLYPRVALHLEERTPERVWEMVAKGFLSAALTRPVPAQDAFGLRTVVLRQEPMGIAVPEEHRLARRTSPVSWAELRLEPLIILSRREGMGLHDAVLAGCRQAGFAPRLAHTPSLIGTVLNYVEIGAGVGVVTDSVMVASRLRFVPLTPVQRVPLVLVWREAEDPPPVQRFRELLLEWKREGRLWSENGV